MIIGAMEVFDKRLSLTDLESLCFMMNSYVQICVKFYDIGLVNNRMQACGNSTAFLLSTKIVDEHLGCINVSKDGIVLAPSSFIVQNLFPNRSFIESGKDKTGQSWNIVKNIVGGMKKV